MGFFKSLKKNIGVEETPTDDQIIDGEENNAQQQVPATFVSEPPAQELPAQIKDRKRGNKKQKINLAAEVPQQQIVVQAIEEPMEEREALKQAKNKGENDWLATNGQLAVDTYELEDHFCVKSAIAGVNSDELDVFIDNAMLVIKGERKDPEPDCANPDAKKYFYQECYWGPFTRQILLPDDVDNSKIKASLKKGVLTIKVPKIQDKKRKISIEIVE